jgi:hypothetical protein
LSGQPAAIRNIKLEPDWQEFTQVLLAEGICAALSVPVELDGGVIGILDLYAAEPRDWDPNEVAALQAYAGWWPACSRRRPRPRLKGRIRVPGSGVEPGPQQRKRAAVQAFGRRHPA